MEDRYVQFACPPLPYYLSAGKASYRPGDEHPNRSRLGMFDWIYVVEGELWLGEEEREWRLRAGELLLLAPDAYHYSAGACLVETTFYWLHFGVDGEWEERAARLLGSDATDPSVAVPMHRHRSYLLRLAKHGLMRDAGLGRTNWDKLIRLRSESSQAAFWEEQQLFLELIRLQDATPERRMSVAGSQLARRTEQYLRQHYTSELDNDRLAEALHFHPNYIARCMKEAFGCTPLEYLQAYRLEQAKLLLLKTDWSIDRIASEVGYRLVPHFSSCFKQREGVSPLQYRKRFMM